MTFKHYAPMMCLTRKLFLLITLATVTVVAKEYNHKECLAWPNSTVWKEEELGDVLTANAVLHGPFPKGYYMDNCEGLGTDAFAISEAGSRICMQAHACK